jgi:hypothetical protein
MIQMYVINMYVCMYVYLNEILTEITELLNTVSIDKRLH